MREFRYLDVLYALELSIFGISLNLSVLYATIGVGGISVNVVALMLMLMLIVLVILMMLVDMGGFFTKLNR